MLRKKAIMDVIRKDFPEHQLLGEETVNWCRIQIINGIIDPIDGTVKFLLIRIPLNCVSIGIEKRWEDNNGCWSTNPHINESFLTEKRKSCKPLIWTNL
jgi:myo-inositol-1(or 4)-monophosphatase